MVGNIETPGTYVGYPARPHGEWGREQIMVTRLPELMKRCAVWKSCSLKGYQIIIRYSVTRVLCYFRKGASASFLLQVRQDVYEWELSIIEISEPCLLSSF